MLLFALSLVLVGLTIYRMQGVTIRHFSQQFRSLLASLEILAAAAVSNALVLGSFVRDRGTKKQRFRFGSTGGHSSLDRSNTAPRRALTARNWGSDADLVGDLGMRLDPELTEKPSAASRPAPLTSPSAANPDVISCDTVDENWTFPDGKSTEIDQFNTHPLDPAHESQQYSPGEIPSTPRGMSFFDVGGLLGNEHPSRMHSRHQSIAAPPMSSQNSLPRSSTPRSHRASFAAPRDGTRRGSHALLQDLGASPEESSPQATSPQQLPESQHSGLIEALQSTPPDTSRQPPKPRPKERKGSLALQDVGGLLS